MSDKVTVFVTETEVIKVPGGSAGPPGPPGPPGAGVESVALVGNGLVFSLTDGSVLPAVDVHLAALGLDGGAPSTVYTNDQHIDGGAPSAVYTNDQHIDGGVA